MPALTWCIGSFTAARAHSDRGHVVTGNCAAPTTLEAVLIKAVITAHSACIRRLRIAIVFDGAMPLCSDAVIRLYGRRAVPLICGFARKSSGDSRLQRVTISIIPGARRLHCYPLVSIK